ncbi:MAG: cobalt transporter [Candidatus Methylomirabilia bacterium]
MRALLLLALPLWLTVAPLAVHAAAGWDGVDKTVVEKFAHAAGRPPREPLINTDRGDLLLFVFLLAGAAGGFVAGYCFRALFPPGGVKKV